MLKIQGKNSNNVDLQKRVEIIGMLIIAAVSIVVPLLDFIGALDAVGWLTTRVPTMTLLGVGSLALYLLSQNHTGMKSIETLLKDNNDEILHRISSERANQKLLDELEKIWSERENDFQKIFRKARVCSQNGNIGGLREYLKEQELLIEKGRVFETKLKYPWDINITAINSEGVYVYHFLDEMISRKKPAEHPNWEILKIRNGSLVWINFDKGKFCQRVPLYTKNLRFTKLYFQEIPELDIIVIIQSHINIVPELPTQP